MKPVGMDSCAISRRAFDKKGYITPKTLTKRGTELFAEGDVDVLRQIDSKSKTIAVAMLPGLLPTIQRFPFSFVECIAGEREWSKVGCDLVPLFGMLARGYTPPSLLSVGSTPFWHNFTLFWHVAIWCAPGWLKDTAGWRLFQLVVVVARRKDYVRRQTTNGPDPLKRDEHT